jgi:hypothetical protein
MATRASQLRRPNLQTRLLPLRHNDDLLAVLPNVDDTDGLNDPKFIP